MRSILNESNYDLKYDRCNPFGLSLPNDCAMLFHGQIQFAYRSCMKYNKW